MTATGIILTSPDTYTASINGKVWAGIKPAHQFYAAVEAAIAGGEPVETPPVPSAQDILAAKRAAAVTDRGPLCLALYAAYILSADSAKEAAKGNWPSEFNGFLAGLNPFQQLAAEIAWADATVVRYSNALLQQAALDFAGTEAAATMVLDQLFGISAP